MRTQDAVGQLDGMAQRDLQDAGAQFDPFGHGGRRRHRANRIGPESTAPDLIEKPQAVETALFRLAQAGAIAFTRRRRGVFDG